MKPGAILATNTSSVEIDEIAAMTNRSEGRIGLTFFSPANVDEHCWNCVRSETHRDGRGCDLDGSGGQDQTDRSAGRVAPALFGTALCARQKQANKLRATRALMPWDVDAALNAFGFKMGPSRWPTLPVWIRVGPKGAKTENPNP